MANKSNSKLSYKGKVTVKLYHGKKVYKTIKEKNSGTLELFKFFANCLTGNYYSQQRPMYLRAFKAVFDNDGNETSRQEVTTTAIPVKRSKPIFDTDNNTASVLNEFLIPAATMSTEAANVLCLYSTEHKNQPDAMSAEVVLEEGIEKENGTSNIKVEWTLVIGNANEEGE